MARLRRQHRRGEPGGELPRTVQQDHPDLVDAGARGALAGQARVIDSPGLSTPEEERAMGSALRFALVGMVVAATFVGGGPAWAGAPTDQLRSRIDRVLKGLDPEDPSAGPMEARRATI